MIAEFTKQKPETRQINIPTELKSILDNPQATNRLSNNTIACCTVFITVFSPCITFHVNSPYRIGQESVLVMVLCVLCVVPGVGLLNPFYRLHTAII